MADRTAVDLAALLPFGVGQSVWMTSTRVGNYRSQPTWGPMFDQLWVR